MNRFSFLQGLFSVFGFCESRTERMRDIITNRSDEKALNDDWLEIGNDFRSAFSKLKTENELSACQ